MIYLLLNWHRAGAWFSHQPPPLPLACTLRMPSTPLPSQMTPTASTPVDAPHLSVGGIAAQEELGPSAAAGLGLGPADDGAGPAGPPLSAERIIEGAGEALELLRQLGAWALDALFPVPSPPQCRIHTRSTLGRGCVMRRRVSSLFAVATLALLLILRFCPLPSAPRPPTA